jgi:cell wall assembly regulator SMI1
MMKTKSEKIAVMKRLFDRVHVWVKKNAPHVREGFARGATQEQIRAAEREMGVSLPDDVRAAYRIHDGFSPPAGGGWCSLERMVRTWRALRAALDGGDFAANRGRPVGPVRPVWYHPAWIPIVDEGPNNHYCIDLAPAAGGHVGQVIRWCRDEPGRYLQAKSFAEWVDRFVSGLEAGNWPYTPGGLGGWNGD